MLRRVQSKLFVDGFYCCFYTIKTYFVKSTQIYKFLQRHNKYCRYTSKFKSNVKNESNKGKFEHRTMGYPKVPLRAPDDFLKKHENEPQLDESGMKINPKHVNIKKKYFL